MNKTTKAISAFLLFLSQHALANSSEDPGITYHYEVTGGPTFQNFGVSLTCVGDIDGDGWDDMLVGNTLSNNNEGGATVFSGKSGQVIRTLRAPGSYLLGESVCAVGDLNQDNVPDMAIGAPLEGESGRIYFFSGLGNDSDPPLGFIDGRPRDRSYGHSLSNMGDLNGDGFSEIIIGSPFFSNNFNSEGQAYVLSGEWAASTFAGNTPSTSMYFARFAGDDDHEQFAWAVSGVGDVNQDGWNDCGVGIRLEQEPNDISRGRVLVFSGQWIDNRTGPQILLDVYGENDGDRFGEALDGVGDVNQDGHDDIAVGAPGNDNFGNGAGRVVVFSGADGTVLFGKDGPPGSVLGASLAGLGDVNADGVPDLIVGALGDSTFGASSGAAFVLSGQNGQTLRSLFGKTAQDRFGTVVSAAGNADGDGFQDFAISAPFENSNGQDAGSVYTYPGSYAINALNRHGEGAPSGTTPPQLAVTGSFQADGDITMTINSDLANQPIILIIGFGDELCAPLNGGGFLVPPPDLQIKGLQLDTNGDLSLNATLPSVNDELNFTFQALFSTAGVLGSSNALRVKVRERP